MDSPGLDPSRGILLGCLLGLTITALLVLAVWAVWSIWS